MASYQGYVAAGGRSYTVAVEGHPGGRTRIAVDGSVVHDKKPFIAVDEVAFNLGSTLATLVWKQVGLTGMDCWIRAGGAEVLLQRRDRVGALVTPEPAGEKRRRNVRFAGGVAVLAAAAFLFVGMPDRDGTYIPKLLAFAPLLLVGGLLSLAAPDATLDMAERLHRNRVLLWIVFLVVIGIAFVAPPLLVRLWMRR